VQRKKFTSIVLWSIFAGTWTDAVFAARLSEGDAAQGIRAALDRGVSVAINLLGRTDGFLGNPKVRIPLPGFLNDAAGLLRATGQKKRLDALEVAMNRAAEAAVPQARTLLSNTVKNLGVEDALRLVRGDAGSATAFFAEKTRVPLGAAFLPIVTRATEKVFLADKYNAVAERAASVGLLKAEDANVQRYVTEKALDGLFAMVADEERKIRQDPIGTGSSLLKKVFGGI
jgi:hypothetical protein